MSRLPKAIKDLISSPSAKPGLVHAPSNVISVLEGIAGDASKLGIGKPSWLCLTAATAFTLNSPASLLALHKYAAADDQGPKTAETIREVGLKCISFNGIPRTINCLNKFRDELSPNVQSQLATSPTRQPTSENIESIKTRGEELWKSIYHPLDEKLVGKLSRSHPDLPIVILNSHYAALLSDPEERQGLASIGRVLTSLVGISCLRAQTGTGPQVTSHIYGLRKAFSDGTSKSEITENQEGLEQLATDAGIEWILNSVDELVDSISGGSSFAPFRSKL